MLNRKNIRSILVWTPNWIGDIVLSIPVLRSLKKEYPESRIAVVVRSPFGDLLSQEKSVDELICYDPDGHYKNFFGKISFLQKLREYKFDMAVALPNSFRAGLMLFLSGATRRVGYASDGRGFLLTDPLPALGRKEEGHRVDYFLSIAAKAGCQAPDKTVSIEVTREEKIESEKFLAPYGLKNSELLIGMHPGASKPPRTMAPEKFSATCNSILEKWKGKILLFGTAQERELLEKVQSRINKDGVIIAGYHLPIRSTISLLQRCDYFIGCDSGLMHMASGTGTPVVGLFGPGVPEHTGPACVENKKAIIFHRFPCAPCSQRFFKECDPSPDGRPPCVEKIEVDEIISALEKLMNV